MNSWHGQGADFNPLSRSGFRRKLNSQLVHSVFPECLTETLHSSHILMYKSLYPSQCSRVE